MINRTVLVGRVTKDINLQYTQSNIAFARFTLAVNRTFMNESGERDADFISCIVWRKQAENMARWIRKGGLVGVEGRIQTGSYDDKDGKRVYTTDVVCDSVQFLEPKTQEEDNEYFERIANQGKQQRANTPTIDVSESDLPF